MPRKPNPLKGVSINDLLEIDEDTLRHMTKPEMRRVVSRMADAANKRLRRLWDAGFMRGRYYGPDSIAGVKKFSTRGLDLQGLHKEYGRLRNFLTSPTSTVTGTRKKVARIREYASHIMNDMRDREAYPVADDEDKSYIYGDEPSSGFRVYSDEEAWEMSLRLFTALRDDERGSAFAGLDFDSDQQRAFAYAYIQGLPANTTLEEMIEGARERLTQMYEDMESEHETLGGISI